MSALPATVVRMDSGWAVVIGALVAFAGTVLGPFFLEIWKKRRDSERARRDELALLIPELIELFTNTPEPIHPGEESAKLTRLQMLLEPSDWQISSILTFAGTPPNRTAVPLGAAVDMCAAWFRGSITAAEAQKRFGQRIGKSFTGQAWDA